MANKWIKKDREWSEYPVGTKAKALTGASWWKTVRGWRKGDNARLYSEPGRDCIDLVCLPVPFLQAKVQNLVLYLERKIREYSDLVKTLEYNLEEKNYRRWYDEREAKALLSVWKTHIKHFEEALTELKST